MLAWDHLTGSDNVGRVPVERKLARVPAPRVFPREPKSLLQANITIDHRSQITEREREREKERERERERNRNRERERESETERENQERKREKSE